MCWPSTIMRTKSQHKDFLRIKSNIVIMCMSFTPEYRSDTISLTAPLTSLMLPCPP